MTPETLFPVPPAPPRTVHVPAYTRRATRRDTQPKARTTDPETSRKAARVITVKAAGHRYQALLAFATYGTLTDFELAEHTRVPQTSIGCRRLELVRLGLVERAEGATRPSPSGSPSAVWRITEAGIVKARELKKERG